MDNSSYSFKPVLIWMEKCYYTGIRRYLDNNMLEILSAYFLKVFDKLNGVNEHFTVYKKEDLPENLHYSDNNRIPDIVIVVEKGWILKKVTNPWCINEL